MSTSMSLLYKDITSSRRGKFLDNMLSFYVPLVFKLPALRNNPKLMTVSVKSTPSSGIADAATNTDIYAQNEIKRHVLPNYPNWQFWGEEGKDNVNNYDFSKEYLLIADPIEGTNNFIAKKDNQWGSVVALVDIKRKEPIIGVVAHPTTRTIYFGLKGKGAYIAKYNNKNALLSLNKMKKAPEYSKFTYNNSPHFEKYLLKQVKNFLSLGKVLPAKASSDKIEKSRYTVQIPGKGGKKVTFVDPESGALEALRYRGTIYFKTSNEMAAVFVILKEIGGVVTDANGEKWSLGINTMISARTGEDYEYLQSLFRKTI